MIKCSFKYTIRGRIGGDGGGGSGDGGGTISSKIGISGILSRCSGGGGALCRFGGLGGGGW